MKRLLVLTCAIIVCATGVGLVGQNWDLKASLRTDVSPNETVLWLDRPASIVVDRAVMIESRDGRFRNAYMVEDVLDDFLVLREPLKEKYSAGSRIFQ